MEQYASEPVKKPARSQLWSDNARHMAWLPFSRSMMNSHSSQPEGMLQTAPQTARARFAGQIPNSPQSLRPSDNFKLSRPSGQQSIEAGGEWTKSR